MKRLLALISFIFSFWMNSPAEVVLPSVFGDHMVLQQNAYVPIWGRAEPGEHIRLEASWEDMQLSIFTDSRGRWRIDIPTPAAGGPFRIQITGENEIALDDVWTGEVWLASGQSNMEWPLQKSEGFAAALAASEDSLIRFFQVEQDVASSARFDCKGVWQLCRPEKAAHFSAVAYYYALKLRKELQVPVAIIQSTWGGTTAEAWMSRASLESKGEFKNMLNRFDEALRLYRQGGRNPDPIQKRQPTTLYNAMIAPLIPYEIRGVIWYQGEANRYDPYLYRELFPTLIESWRKDWQRNLPFYYVQIAPFDYPDPQVGAGIREAQRLTLQRVPKTGMAVSLDIGNPADIHPLKKREVGERLALWALAQSYGQAAGDYSGPLYDRMEKTGDSIRLYFEPATSGLISGSAGLIHFVIAGADRKFLSARAQIEGHTVRVWHDSVPQPQAVRYAFQNANEASLFNPSGLPASSFRTDDWPVFYGQPKVEMKYLPEEENYELEMFYAMEALPTEIHYTEDGSVPNLTSPRYTGPFRVPPPALLKWRLFAGDTPDPQVYEKKLANHLGMRAQIIYQTAAHPAFQGGGKHALTDGIEGTAAVKGKYWRGFEGQDFEIILDLGQKKDLHLLETHFLQIKRENIFLPLEVEMAVSGNGRNYKVLDTFRPEQSSNMETPAIAKFLVDAKGNRGRYLRLRAKSIGNCPDWHPDGGKASFMFIDEWVIR